MNRPDNLIARRSNYIYLGRYLTLEALQETIETVRNAGKYSYFDIEAEDNDILIIPLSPETEYEKKQKEASLSRVEMKTKALELRQLKQLMAKHGNEVYGAELLPLKP